MGGGKTVVWTWCFWRLVAWEMLLWRCSFCEEVKRGSSKSLFNMLCLISDPIGRDIYTCFGYRDFR
jgi:hypothetical protein